MVHINAEILRLDHMGGEEEVQGIAKGRNVSESILLRIVQTFRAHHVRWGKRYVRSRGFKDRGGDFLHCMRLVGKRVKWSFVAGVAYSGPGGQILILVSGRR